MLRRRRDFDQGAVQTVADTEFVGERFEVDVGRLVSDGLLEDQIDESDDRGVVGGLFEGVRVAEIDAFRVMDLLQFVQDAFDGVVGLRIVDVEHFIDFGGYADIDAAFAVQREGQFVDELVVEGFARGDDEHVVVFDGDRDDAVETCDVRRELLHDLFVDFMLVEGVDLRAEIFGDELEELLFRDDIEVVEDVDERLVVLRAFLIGFFELVFCGEFGVQQ